MEALRSRAVSPTLRRKWADAKDFLPLTNSAYRTSDGVTIHLKAPIEKVQDILFKAMKAKRKAVRAVRFTNGQIEELHSIQLPDGKKGVKLPKPEKKEDPQPVVATTVAQPNRGCPMPEFQEADVRADRVLEAFLDKEQIEDYRKTGAFISVGADTGHRYMVCNREKPSFMKKHCGGRQLYDMEDQRSICVHDWAVPPAEEMLGLHLELILPGHERDMLKLPEVYEDMTFIPNG
jgi:hypothetical protein